MRKNEHKKELLDLGLLPTKEQELLLKAALLKGEEAIKAWHEWKTCVDIEFIDHGSNRLLPLLYFNLVQNDINDPIINPRVVSSVVLIPKSGFLRRSFIYLASIL